MVTSSRRQSLATQCPDSGSEQISHKKFRSKTVNQNSLSRRGRTGIISTGSNNLSGLTGTRLGIKPSYSTLQLQYKNNKLAREKTAAAAAKSIKSNFLFYEDPTTRQSLAYTEKDADFGIHPNNIESGIKTRVSISEEPPEIRNINKNCSNSSINTQNFGNTFNSTVFDNNITDNFGNTFNSTVFDNNITDSESLTVNNNTATVTVINNSSTGSALNTGVNTGVNINRRNLANGDKCIGAFTSNKGAYGQKAIIDITKFRRPDGIPFKKNNNAVVIQHHPLPIGFHKNIGLETGISIENQGGISTESQAQGQDGISASDALPNGDIEKHLTKDEEKKIIEEEYMNKLEKIMKHKHYHSTANTAKATDFHNRLSTSHFHDENAAHHYYTNKLSNEKWFHQVDHSKSNYRNWLDVEGMTMGGDTLNINTSTGHGNLKYRDEVSRQGHDQFEERTNFPRFNLEGESLSYRDSVMYRDIGSAFSSDNAQATEYDERGRKVPLGVGKEYDNHGILVKTGEGMGGPHRIVGYGHEERNHPGIGKDSHRESQKGAIHEKNLDRKLENIMAEKPTDNISNIRNSDESNTSKMGKHYLEFAGHRLSHGDIDKYMMNSDFKKKLTYEHHIYDPQKQSLSIVGSHLQRDNAENEAFLNRRASSVRDNRNSRTSRRNTRSFYIDSKDYKKKAFSVSPDGVFTAYDDENLIDDVGIPRKKYNKKHFWGVGEGANELHNNSIHSPFDSEGGRKFGPQRKESLTLNKHQKLQKEIEEGNNLSGSKHIKGKPFSNDKRRELTIRKAEPHSNMHTIDSPCHWRDGRKLLDHFNHTDENGNEIVDDGVIQQYEDNIRNILGDGSADDSINKGHTLEEEADKKSHHKKFYKADDHLQAQIDHFGTHGDMQLDEEIGKQEEDEMIKHHLISQKKHVIKNSETGRRASNLIDHMFNLVNNEVGRDDDADQDLEGADVNEGTHKKHFGGMIAQKDHLERESDKDSSSGSSSSSTADPEKTNVNIQDHIEEMGLMEAQLGVEEKEKRWRRTSGLMTLDGEEQISQKIFQQRSLQEKREVQENNIGQKVRETSADRRERRRSARNSSSSNRRKSLQGTGCKVISSPINNDGINGESANDSDFSRNTGARNSRGSISPPREKERAHGSPTESYPDSDDARLAKSRIHYTAREEDYNTEDNYSRFRKSLVDTVDFMLKSSNDNSPISNNRRGSIGHHDPVALNTAQIEQPGWKGKKARFESPNSEERAAGHGHSGIACPRGNMSSSNSEGGITSHSEGPLGKDHVHHHSHGLTGRKSGKKKYDGHIASRLCKEERGARTRAFMRHNPHLVSGHRIWGENHGADAPSLVASFGKEKPLKEMTKLEMRMAKHGQKHKTNPDSEEIQKKSFSPRGTGAITSSHMPDHHVHNNSVHVNQDGSLNEGLTHGTGIPGGGHGKSGVFDNLLKSGRVCINTHGRSYDWHNGYNNNGEEVNNKEKYYFNPKNRPHKNAHGLEVKHHHHGHKDNDKKAHIKAALSIRNRDHIHLNDWEHSDKIMSNGVENIKTDKYGKTSDDYEQEDEERGDKRDSSHLKQLHFHGHNIDIDNHVTENLDHHTELQHKIGLNGEGYRRNIIVNCDLQKKMLLEDNHIKQNCRPGQINNNCNDLQAFVATQNLNVPLAEVGDLVNSHSFSLNGPNLANHEHRQKMKCNPGGEKEKVVRSGAILKREGEGNPENLSWRDHCLNGNISAKFGNIHGNSMGGFHSSNKSRNNAKRELQKMYLGAQVKAASAILKEQYRTRNYLEKIDEINWNNSNNISNRINEKNRFINDHFEENSSNNVIGQPRDGGIGDIYGIKGTDQKKNLIHRDRLGRAILSSGEIIWGGKGGISSANDSNMSESKISKDNIKLLSNGRMIINEKSAKIGQAMLDGSKRGSELDNDYNDILRHNNGYNRNIQAPKPEPIFFYGEGGNKGLKGIGNYNGNTSSCDSLGSNHSKSNRSFEGAAGSRSLSARGRKSFHWGQNFNLDRNKLDRSNSCVSLIERVTGQFNEGPKVTQNRVFGTVWSGENNGAMKGSSSARDRSFSRGGDVTPKIGGRW